MGMSVIANLERRYPQLHRRFNRERQVFFDAHPPVSFRSNPARVLALASFEIFPTGCDHRHVGCGGIHVALIHCRANIFR